jgi:hypothetical protein
MIGICFSTMLRRIRLVGSVGQGTKAALVHSTEIFSHLHSAQHADAIRSQDAAACGERAIINRLWLYPQAMPRFETRSLPALTHVLPPISTSRFCPSMSLASPRGSVHTLLPSSLRPVRLGPFHETQVRFAPRPIHSIKRRERQSPAFLREASRPCR